MKPELQKIADATRGTEYEGKLWLVGGAVRDELLGGGAKNDYDLVTTEDAIKLAHLFFEQGLTLHAPVVYPRFGTAMVTFGSVSIELITARRESYEEASRKPSVEPATLEEDALRRDFTVNALLRNVHSGEIYDPLGKGLDDLRKRFLRTPLDPAATFHEDPLRMLRAVRFRWQLGLKPVPGLYEAIAKARDRLGIISAERIRDELLKILLLDAAADALQDLMDLGLLDVFAPELRSMVGVEQGAFHHLDVWRHSLLVLRNVREKDVLLRLAGLLHDVGKPSTRFVDEQGNVRFFGHEAVGADMARAILRRLKMPVRDIETVALLVRNHMRLGSAPVFTPTAARRLIRDMDGQLENLLTLVEADVQSLRPGVRKMDLEPIREQVAKVQHDTPRKELESPLSGQEIMALLDLNAGPEVGRLKDLLTEAVLEGEIAAGDKVAAEAMLRKKSHLSP